VGKFHIGPLHFDDPESNDEIPAIDPNMDLDSEMADSILGIYQSVISSKVRDITGADYAASIQWENPEQIPVKQLRHHNLEWQTQGVADFFANRENEKPFFLHLNSTALHGPSLDLTLEQDPKYTPGGRIDNPYKYHPPRETIYDRLDSMGIDMSESVPDYIRHYNAGIPYLDDQVGAVIQILRENNALENTLIILTADHGIEPGKSVNYNIGVRVPFIAKWDKQIKPESVSDQIVQFTDFMPTFAELASVDIEENHIVDGMSFVPALHDQPMPDRKAYFEMGYLRGIMDDYYKYISLRYPQQDLELIQKGTDRMVSHFGIGEGQQAFAVIAMEYHPGYFDADQLYDMKNDYYEQNNLAKINEYSDTLQLYKNELKKVLESFTHPYPIDNNEFTHWDKYWELANEARKVGTSTIYWWERDLDYPPQDNERMYKLQ
jgi:arylsulfatase A-like enzyme